MSIELLELAAARLGPMVDEVAFVGGASFAVWADDPGAPAPRATIDVDVIVVVDGHGDYYQLAERLRQQGFTEDAEGGVICRWRHTGLVLDVMPTDETILGFTNRWYDDALRAAEAVSLPSGAVIQVVTPPYLLATKLEAFRGRGNDDYLASVDFEDIVRLIDGRERLVAEVETAPDELRAEIARELGRMLADERFDAAISAGLLPDPASQARREIVLERVRRMAQSA